MVLSTSNYFHINQHTATQRTCSVCIYIYLGWQVQSGKRAAARFDDTGGAQKSSII
jgi:hypothetical protein